MKKADSYSVCISFSGLVFRFVFPNYIRLPNYFTELVCDDCEYADEEFEVRLLTEPLIHDAEPVFVNNNTKIFNTSDGQLRIYSSLTENDGCQVACFISNKRKNILYYPESRWDYYSAQLHCFHLIAGELLLLRHNAFLLHSSVVMHNEKAVLFFGPSGVGKSTQAKLWCNYIGADIINGDRCVIMQKNGIFLGGGSPWCGTSEIRRKEQAPIAGIFFINQSDENSVLPLGDKAFKHLISQTVVNSWDVGFMSAVTQMIAELILHIPVYQLNCRPDNDAVNVAYSTLFGKVNDHGK